jgi:hypothetical protein
MLDAMRRPRPDLQLLANGDILFPERADGGGWRISRVTPGDVEYADRLCEVQDQDRRPGLLARGVTFWLSAVVVWFGLIAVAAVLAHVLA